MDELFNALKTAYGKGSKYGVSDEAIGRVAALGATANMNTEHIAAFVVAAEPMFKKEQSEADRVRTELNAKIKGLEGEKAALEAKLNGNNPPDKDPDNEPGKGTPDIAAIVAQAVAAAINPLQEKLNAFEITRTKEAAVAALDKFCAEWDYAGGFPKERDEAKRIALKLYKAGGEKMDGEQLIAAFREEFDPAVKDKGVTDFSKPFQSDGGAGEGDADFSSFDRAAKELGWTEPEK